MIARTLYIQKQKADIIGFICFIIDYITLGTNMLRGHTPGRVTIDIFHFGGGTGVFGVTNQ